MYCSKCGAQNPEEARFCSNCGGGLKTDVQISTDTKKPKHNVCSYFLKTAEGKYHCIKSATEEEAIKYAKQKYNVKQANLRTLEGVISDFTQKGYGIEYKDEKVIVFKGEKKKRSGCGCIPFLLLVPVLIGLITGIFIDPVVGFYWGLGSVSFCWTIAGILFLIDMFAPKKEERISLDL